MLIGPEGTSFFEDGKIRPFDREEMNACRGKSRGYTQGFESATREKSTAETIAFFRQAFGQ
ncbi:MAG: hypothetical protein EXR04_04605 [Rhodospirillales bacterium]|nr:hypothetical protein [Rhodospirillales bacterium]